MDVLFILGMHRSGTSVLAKCLQQMGVDFDLPNLRDGYWEKHIEYYQVNQLNDRILKSWKAPRLKRNALSQRYFEWQVSRLVKNNIPDTHLIGIKDPRLLLTFGYWARSISQFRCIGIVRRPEEVARSLSIRDEYGKASFESGLNLWKVHNQQLLDLQSRYNFPIIDYNLPKADVSRQLEAACNRLSLDFSLESFDGVFSEAKRHHHSESIPSEHASLYKELIDIAHS